MQEAAAGGRSVDVHFNVNGFGFVVAIRDSGDDIVDQFVLLLAHLGGGFFAVAKAFDNLFDRFGRCVGGQTRKSFPPSHFVQTGLDFLANFSPLYEAAFLTPAGARCCALSGGSAGGAARTFDANRFCAVRASRHLGAPLHHLFHLTLALGAAARRAATFGAFWFLASFASVDFRHASLELVEGALSSSGGLELSAASQAASVPVEFRFFVGGAHRQRFKVGGASRLPVEAFSVLAFPAGRRGGFAGDAAVSGADGLFIGCAGGEGRERSFASGVLGVSALGNRDSASHATLIVAGGLNTSSAFGGQSAGRRLSGGLGKFAAGAAGSEVEFGSFINSANGKRGPRTGSHLFRTASHRRGSGVFWDGSLRFAEVSVAKILAALGVSGVGGSFGAMF